MKCSTPLQVSENACYFQCHTCNTMFNLHWSNGKVERQTVLENISQRMEAGFSDEDLQFTASELQVKLRTYNDSIRNVEMAKGAERIRVMAILLFIAATIYLLFRFTVQGTSILAEPGIYELSAAGVVAFSLLIIIIFKIFKAAMVGKVNKLITERDIVNEELQRVEATRDLQAEELVKEINAEKPSEEERAEKQAQVEAKEEPNNDIIERFASRKKSGRKRLNLRED